VEHKGQINPGHIFAGAVGELSARIMTAIIGRRHPQWAASSRWKCWRTGNRFQRVCVAGTDVDGSIFFVFLFVFFFCIFFIFFCFFVYFFFFLFFTASNSPTTPGIMLNAVGRRLHGGTQLLFPDWSDLGQHRRLPRFVRDRDGV